MEVQELINIWNDYDKKLDENLKVNKQLLKEVSLGKIRSFLSEFKWNSIIEICFDWLFALFLIGFIVDHFGDFRFSGPALLLLLFMISGLVLNIYKLVQLRKINAATPVIQTQKILGRLRFYTVKEIESLYIVIPLFSGAFLIVIAKALLGFNLYLLGNWLISFVMGSVVVALIIVWFFKKFPDKKMEKAIRFLEEIGEFEKG